MRTSVHLEVPSVVLEAMREGGWPKGRIRGSILQASGPFPADCDVELLQSLDEMVGEASEISDISWLRKCADNPELASKYQVTRGTANAGPIELPWLDVEQALVIGGGADYGDDTLIVLDYRSKATEPRVVVNVWSQGRPLQVEWRELAPTVTRFMQMLGPGDKR